jgi:hypothetical protein
MFECHIDVLIPKKSLDKLKVKSSRDPSGVVAINRECYGKVQYLLYLQHYLAQWSHFARLVILAVGVPTWKLAWNFSAQQVQAEL